MLQLPIVSLQMTGVILPRDSGAKQFSRMVLGKIRNTKMRESKVDSIAEYVPRNVILAFSMGLPIGYVL